MTVPPTHLPTSLTHPPPIRYTLNMHTQYKQMRARLEVKERRAPSKSVERRRTCQSNPTNEVWGRSPTPMQTPSRKINPPPTIEQKPAKSRLFIDVHNEQPISQDSQRSKTTMIQTSIPKYPSHIVYRKTTKNTKSQTSA